ncbi:MAG: 30S ribosome-binding factor RbfA [Candidatus Nealsonbacteria bacterium]|nr:MAG: 30S ribosome-binding factor RbfA [Candidatus Nealsonbacteria bacterium]
MSRRIQKVNQLIKKELSQIVLKEMDFLKKVLVTLTRVDTSPDLEQAKVFISVIPEEESQQALETLNKSIYYLQQKLNQRLKMRPVPRIKFMEEKRTKEAGRVEELLEKIKRP